MGRVTLAVIATACLFACSTTPVQQRASVLEYLYPEGTPVVPPADVHLNLPLRVGLAFAPARDPGRSHGSYWSSGFEYTPSFDASAQQRLLDRVIDAFEGTAGVQSIQIVPPNLVETAGGFENVDQLRNLLGLDVIALLSYEQTQFQDFDHASLTYLTVVGAYLFEANRNETHTFVDTSVFDIGSRALLFNAGGHSIVKGDSTAVEASEELREDSIAGFEGAIDAMIVELQASLQAFREQAASGTVRGAGTPALAVHGAEGAGAVGALELGLGLLLAGGCLLGRRARRA